MRQKDKGGGEDNFFLSSHPSFSTLFILLFHHSLFLIIWKKSHFFFSFYFLRDRKGVRKNFIPVFAALSSIYPETVLMKMFHRKKKGMLKKRNGRSYFSSFFGEPKMVKKKKNRI